MTVSQQLIAAVESECGCGVGDLAVPPPDLSLRDGVPAGPKRGIGRLGHVFVGCHGGLVGCSREK